ncbi:hypothetical protein [Mageeibacillus indolicus]|uniref:hypothetical protein n=1 Tax=Mageeibacillus indolicus TaxID=884684 RepID=UPI0004DCCCEB|nr:hypothetical protein [Mageeibacillus indolicus]KFA56821.1 hypothetical protein HMPREF1632_06700 [Mageeibacillus indolicus 0009-5]
MLRDKWLILKHRLGAMIIAVLTILLAVNVYRVSYNLSFDDPLTWPEVIKEKLAALPELSLHRAEMEPEVCGMLRFRSTGVVLFRMHDKPEWNGLVIMRKGFNQRWRLSGLQFGINRSVNRWLIRAGGQRSLLIYAGTMPDGTESVNFIDEQAAAANAAATATDSAAAVTADKRILYTAKVSGEFCLIKIEQEESPQLWQYFIGNGTLPKLQYRGSYGTLYPEQSLDLLAAARSRDTRVTYTENVTVWAVLILIVGMLLSVRQWQYAEIMAMDRQQAIVSRHISKLLNKHQRPGHSSSADRHMNHHQRT